MTSIHLTIHEPTRSTHGVCVEPERDDNNGIVAWLVYHDHAYDSTLAKFENEADANRFALKLAHYIGRAKPDSSNTNSLEADILVAAQKQRELNELRSNIALSIASMMPQEVHPIDTIAIATSLFLESVLGNVSYQAYTEAKAASLLYNHQLEELAADKSRDSR